MELFYVEQKINLFLPCGKTKFRSIVELCEHLSHAQKDSNNILHYFILHFHILSLLVLFKRVKKGKKGKLCITNSLESQYSHISKFPKSRKDLTSTSSVFTYFFTIVIVVIVIVISTNNSKHRYGVFCMPGIINTYM